MRKWNIYYEVKYGNQVKEWRETVQHRIHRVNEKFVFKYDISQRNQQIHLKLGIDSTGETNSVKAKNDPWYYDTGVYCVNASFSIIDCLLLKGKSNLENWLILFRRVPKGSKYKHQHKSYPVVKSPKEPDSKGELIRK